MLGVRSNNLRLLRYLYDGLGKLAIELSPILNEAALIKMGQGEKEITDAVAKSIEEELNLPCNWMDRDNYEILKISALDYEILKKISVMSESRKRGLEAFIL